MNTRQRMRATTLQTSSDRFFHVHRWRSVFTSCLAFASVWSAGCLDASPLVVWDGVSGPRFIHGEEKRLSEPVSKATREAVVPSGYLARAQSQSLRWDQSRPSATETTVLHFGPRKLEKLESEPPPPVADTVAFSHEERATTLDSNETVQDITAEVSSITIADLYAQNEKPEPVKEKAIIDEQFVNWVTRRMGDSKVEVPFQLPTENNAEPVAPTERVRVRYRVEP